MENQLFQEEQKRNNLLKSYINIAISSILSILIGIFLYIILMNIFHLSFVYVFIIVVLFAMLISPLLSKINFGEKIAIKYMEFLERIVSKINKNGKTRFRKV